MSSNTISSALFALVLCASTVGARKLLEPADQLDIEQTYECIGSGVLQHPCIINPAYTFSAGIKLNSSSLQDRVYQSILAQHVVCRQYTTQATCQGTPASAKLYCSWDAMNSRCTADPYASLLLPMFCPGSRAHSFLSCGRKGLINACRADTECVLGKQARCFPAWLLSEARAKNKTEQDIAEATALGILKGDGTVVGRCPTAQLLQRTMKACPFTAGWDTCDTSLCDFNTPSFIPSRTQALDLGNSTATAPVINEAAMQPNTSSGLPFFDMFPGPICFPDIGRTPVVLHTLLGITDDVSEQLDVLQTKCIEAEDVVYDVAKGLAACGLDSFSFNRHSLYRTVGLTTPPPQPPPNQQNTTGPAPSKGWQWAAALPAPAASSNGISSSSSSNSTQAPAPEANSSNSSSSGSSLSGNAANTTQGSSDSDQQQRPKISVEIGFRG